MNDRWAYKISAGGYTSDAFARPTGADSERHRHAVSERSRTRARRSRSSTRAWTTTRPRTYKLVFAGGYSGTDGIFHTGIGPFDAHRRRRRLRHDALHARRAEVQLLHQHPQRRRHGAAGDRHRRPADPVRVQHPDLRLRARQHQHHRHAATCSATAATSASTTSICRLRRAATTARSSAPTSRTRSSCNDHVRLNLGARIDKFDNIDDPVFSPRAALILKPTADHAIRVSYNKAFRSPSLINNYLDTTIINQLNLGADQPGAGRRRSTTSRCARSATSR